jgi:hypothetical protein
MVGPTRAGALPKTDYPQLSSTATRPLGKEHFPDLSPQISGEENSRGQQLLAFSAALARSFFS